jgi:hypothetical protein
MAQGGDIVDHDHVAAARDWRQIRGRVDQLSLRQGQDGLFPEMAAEEARWRDDSVSLARQSCDHLARDALDPADLGPDRCACIYGYERERHG